jgi:hypothetical protein
VLEERRSGASKMSKSIIFEALGMVWRLYFRARFRRAPVCHVQAGSGRFKCCQPR